MSGAMRLGLLTVISAACILGVGANTPARAGAYHVIACSGSGGPEPITFNVNNSWTQIPATPPTGLEAFESCPPQGSLQHNGIVAEDHIPGPPDPVPGAEVFWRFSAPPGTTITHLDVKRFLGKSGDQAWRP